MRSRQIFKTAKPARRRRGKIRRWRIGRRGNLGRPPPAKLSKGMQSGEKAEGYEQGYRDGLTDGVEKLLVEHLPPDLIIPEITAVEAMAAGVQALRSRGVPLLNADAVFQELDAAISEKRPYAFIRLGDGELLTLAQDMVLPIDAVRQAGPFLPYAGINVPDPEARDELAAAVRVASLVGVPMSRHPHFQPLLFRVLRAHGIDFHSIRYTTSTMNYTLQEAGYLERLLRGRRILIIGNVAIQLAQLLQEQGFEIAGIVTPVRGYADVRRVVAEAAGYDFDLALVAAGIPAIPITVHLAGKTGRAALDFGHLANRMAGIH